MITRKYICLLGLLLTLLCPVQSSAEITFYVLPEGDKGFIIEGGPDIKETATVEIKVGYDPARIANPQVSVDGGIVKIVDNYPGTLVFNATQGDNPAPSFAARLIFEKIGDSPMGTISVTGQILDEDGTISSTRTMLGASSSSELILSDNNEAPVSKQEITVTDIKLSNTGIRADAPIKARKCIHQRFREFRGERGLKAFVTLFEPDPHDMIVQTPPVVLSDGKTPVRITLPLQPAEKDTPNIVLTDATLVNLEKDGEKGWVITVLPKEGTWNARLFVMGDEHSIEFPLVVAPPVNIHNSITEKNFVAELDRYIFEQSAAAKGDNGPLHGIPCEYIFTANYLANSGNTPGKMPPELASVVPETKK